MTDEQIARMTVSEIEEKINEYTAAINRLAEELVLRVSEVSE